MTHTYTPAQSAMIRALPCQPRVATLRELVQDNIQTFGYYEAAKLLKKKVCFTLAYWLIFGKAPRKLTAKA